MEVEQAGVSVDDGESEGPENCAPLPRGTNVGEIITSPLLLASVLEQVFRNLPYTDLQNCRQVCRLWRKEALRTLGLRLKVDLSDADSVGVVLKSVKDQGCQVSELCVFDLDLNDRPFQELFLRSSSTLSVFRVFDSSVTATQWQKLMRRADGLVRLEIGRLKDGESPVKTFPIHSSSHQPVQFPHLNHLEFLPSGSPNPVFLSDVVRTCPNLRKIVTGNFMEENPMNFAEFRLPLLESLEITIVSGLLVDCLSRLRLSVRMLGLSNFVPDLSPSLLQEFIESQGQSLKSLVLTQGRAEEDPFVEHVPCTPFPLKCPNLDTLEVEKPFVRNMSHVISSDSFPNLRHVFLRFDPGSNWERCLPKNLKSHGGVSHLSIEWIEERPLAQMVQAFPNLKELDMMYCDDKLLRIIFTHLPGLEVLSVEDSEYRAITDAGLTGYPNGSVEDSERVWPYLGNLKKLHLLSLDFKFHPVTEKAILKGIVDVTSLKVLRIFGMQVSPQVKDVLLEKLVNLETHSMEVGSSLERLDSTFDSTFMEFSDSDTNDSDMSEYAVHGDFELIVDDGNN